MAEREVTEVLESYRDSDGKMRYALKGAVIDAPSPRTGSAKASPAATRAKKAAPKKK